ncbi:type II toxin-antitoxin system VapC family toxin [Natronosalvus caseinilyticus]|uniref:type II toxin-antitoxin system VapC family toxin n=1 Tax=Natronosalvus caseinilyticus TaxID=2953747 RepID=UPI0028AC1710|nr:type II toxin-antitoxin system VapC family toxin [Natronosalvus caseinilyticus]
MTVLIDTGVLYADHDTDAARHDAARTALEAAYDGEHGVPYISDYIFDEAITLTRMRAGSYEPAKRLSDRLQGVGPYPQAYELLRVSATVFDETIAIFERYDDHPLSFTDATSIALCERHEIDALMSFDDDFDGLVPRLDPETVP